MLTMESSDYGADTMEIALFSIVILCILAKK